MTIQNELIKSLKGNGDTIAIECGKETISYSMLFNRANKITSFLLRQKFPAETFIGISVRDRSDIICSVIGVMNARCAFVLLDNSLPSNRLTSMIKELNLGCLISDENMRNINTAENSMKVYAYNEILAQEEESAPDEFQYPAYDDDDSLYVYFTS